jgi:septal ring factor EnvC (AmiA/AmiB activator)
MKDTIKLEKNSNSNNPNFSAYREIGTPEEEIQYWKVGYEKLNKQNQELMTERDTALEQLESTKSRLKGERAAAREAIDAAEAERDKAYERFYKNPDAANTSAKKRKKKKLNGKINGLGNLGHSHNT